MLPKLFTKADCGCYFDGARGYRIGEAVQKMAGAYGWQGEPLGASDDCYDDATDEAVDFLNSLCDDTCYFEFDAGDFLLRETSDNE